MKKSAIFTIIFTFLVMAIFYFYSSNQKITQNLSSLSNSTKMTMNEVAKHNKKNDCYLAIENKVYNVSSYVSSHPGGQGKIISVCGQEVTGVFASIHSNFAWDLLKNYQIGQI
jgi:cytochrome b involved in lipid metabolism